MLLGAGRGAGLAGDSGQLWGALVYAADEGLMPGGMPPELRRHSRALARVFGYRQYEIVGQQVSSVVAADESWLLPGGDFSVAVRRLDGAGSRWRGELQLYQGRRLLVRTEVELASGAPIFVRGPLYRRGQLILVFELR